MSQSDFYASWPHAHWIGRKNYNHGYTWNLLHLPALPPEVWPVRELHSGRCSVRRLQKDCNLALAPRVERAHLPTEGAPFPVNSRRTRVRPYSTPRPQQMPCPRRSRACAPAHECAPHGPQPPRAAGAGLALTPKSEHGLRPRFLGGRVSWTAASGGGSCVAERQHRRELHWSETLQSICCRGVNLFDGSNVILLSDRC